jgi:hypothetical protein
MVKGPFFPFFSLTPLDMWPLHTSPLVYLKTHLLASGKTTEGTKKTCPFSSSKQEEEERPELKMCSMQKQTPSSNMLQCKSTQSSSSVHKFIPCRYTTPFDPTTIYHLVTLSSVLFLNFSTFEPWNLLYFFSALVACQFADWAMDKHEIGFIPHMFTLPPPLILTPL